MPHNVRVRFAPSPTGEPHVGSLWIALFDFVFARQQNGKFLIRIEDTDRQRLVPGAQERILEALEWYGLTYDGQPVIQSEHVELHRKKAEALVASGHAYYCFCTPERLEQLRKQQEAKKQAPRYDKHCATLTKDEVAQRRGNGEPCVIRLNVPASGQITHHDLIRGDVTFRFDQVDDQVLLKSDGFPTYHLANVVDDHEMKISHVIRAEEWLPSIPKHLLLYQAFGWKPPYFAHLPLLLGSDRSKLSKRHGATSALSFRDRGYLPEAMVNFLALMGWHPKGETEILSMADIIQQFRFEDMNAAGAIFDEQKLDWMNGWYIRQLPLIDVHQRLQTYWHIPSDTPGTEFELKVIELVRDRLHRLSDMDELANWIFQSAWDENVEQTDAALFIPKKSNAATTIQRLQWVVEQLQQLAEPWQAVELKQHVLKTIQSASYSNMEVLWPLRVALSLRAASPDVFDIAAVVGKSETIRRVEAVLKRLR